MKIFTICEVWRKLVRTNVFPSNVNRSNYSPLHASNLTRTKVLQLMNSCDVPRFSYDLRRDLMRTITSYIMLDLMGAVRLWGWRLTGICLYTTWEKPLGQTHIRHFNSLTFPFFKGISVTFGNGDSELMLREFFFLSFFFSQWHWDKCDPETAQKCYVEWTNQSINA